MTSSRTPRDTRLRLVPQQPVAAARRTVTTRRSRSTPRPPDGVLPREQLARHARASLSDAVRLARWAAHNAHTAHNAHNSVSLRTSAEVERAAAALRMPVPQIRAHWDRARLAGLVELHGDTARPGWRLRAWDDDDSAVLRGWVALFDAWSLAHPAPAPHEQGLVAEIVEAVPQFLSVMHLSGGPVTFPLLHDLLAQRIAELRAERDPEARTAVGVALPGLLDWALDGLSAVGALTRCADEGPSEHTASTANAAITDGTDGTDGTAGGTGTARQGSAVLTPLGHWAMWTKLEQICVAAQSPAGNIERSAEAMLRGCARMTPGPARDEYRAWLAARPTGPAVTELLDAARGEDALIRGLAFEALRVVGAPAEEAVNLAAREPTLRPYALLWQAEQAGTDPEDLAGGAPGVLTREEATWLWVDTAAAVTDHGEERLLVDHLGTAVQGSVPGLLREVRATGHPRTVQVLVALAAAHPDPALAKAVRRAAFQVHTGGE